MSTRTNGATPTSAEPGLIAALDVGTTKVCGILGRKAGTKGVEILGHSTVPCDGLRKGNVSDIAATEKAVRQCVRELESSTGFRIESGFVGLTGSHVSFENRRDRLDTAGEKGVITSDDLNRSPRTLDAAASEPGRQIIHTVKMSYSLDGRFGIRNPLGMHSNNVEVETHLVTGRGALINRLVEAVENAGVRVDSLVLEPLASGLAVLKPQEKERGAVIVDIGGGTTDVVCFRQGRINYTGVIPVGGFQFTNDIVLTFNTSYEAAEAAKLKYASTEVQGPAIDTEEILLPVAGRDTDVKVQRQEICQLTRERALELTKLIKLKLYEQGEKLSADRLVLTGGTSNLPGLAALMQRSLAMPVRQGIPILRGALPEELKNSAYATSVGILLWAIAEGMTASGERQSSSNGTKESGPEGLVSGFMRRLRNMKPFAPFAARKGRI